MVPSSDNLATLVTGDSTMTRTLALDHVDKLIDWTTKEADKRAGHDRRLLYGIADLMRREPVRSPAISIDEMTE